MSKAQCTVAATGSYRPAGGTTLTLALAITFSQNFAGNQGIYAAAPGIRGGNPSEPLP